MAIKIITTEDGSQSLFDDALNETYHSTRGAMGESLHVFIREGLEYHRDHFQKDPINILEVGLGTGLNVWLSAKFAEENQVNIQLSSLEPFPIQPEVYSNLNYGNSDSDKKLLQEIHSSPWEMDIQLNDFLVFLKEKKRLEEFRTNSTFDVIYFDAFAPSKQAEVWDIANLKKCFGLLSKNGVLTTYCAQGQFKRNLAEVGFKVETLQGAMGKKEMVKALK